MVKPMTKVLVLGLLVFHLEVLALGQTDTPAAAQALGRTRTAVQVQPDGLFVCEAEEFQLTASSTADAGWQARRFGENYYAATFANSFLSRKAFLGAPRQCDRSVASIGVDVKTAGRYLVLVRYEAAYRFQTQFRVQVEQAGKLVLDRLYGARKNLKIWAFSEKLKTEVGWSWGAVENIVWEGHDAFADLQPGRATIRLIAAKQPEPAAKRNVDLVMLTTDVAEVKMRIEKEKYLPLDGLLTQSGDVFLRVSNLGDQPLTFKGKPAYSGGNWQQHSPYWVHLRNWKPAMIPVPVGKTSDWVEVGSSMDSLADGQWFWTGDGRYKAEFGLRTAGGKIESLAVFTGQGDLTLAADADTRYGRRLRRQDTVLYDLLDYLKKENPASHGQPLRRTSVYATTFDALDQGKHAAAVKEFKQLFSLSETRPDATGGRGYIDVRSVPTPKLVEYCQGLGDRSSNVAVVSLGDEIGLPAPSGKAARDGFSAWLKEEGVKLANLFPGGKGSAAGIVYNIDPSTKKSNPGLYYWSKRYQYHFGIQAIKVRTEILRRHLPNAAIGANFSPHYPQEHMFLGEVFKWVSVFRESGMTLPWSEDYIWQVAVGTPQMNNINLDFFRAANRHHPERKIMYYVMPHMPNNTPRQWKRLFYSALGHGMKIVNLFEFRPVHVAYTENHVDEPRMYRMILGSFRELGLFEDIVQDGHVPAAEAALWFSQTGDIWGDSHGSFAAGKRALYTAIRHQQIPLDFVVEPDALDGTLENYKVLYLADAHVSTRASAKIAAWVKNGGRLFATVGAGLFDELNRPNEVLREILGIDPAGLEKPDDSRIIWIKQDLPFSRIIDVAKMPAEPDRQGSSEKNQQASFPVVGVRGRFRATADSQVEYRFGDGSPAVVKRQVGKGAVTYCGLLPGLSYYQPAIPRRPVDRGSTDEAMIHFLPTDFDPNVAQLIASPAAGSITRPVTSSHPLVESMVIQSDHGLAIVLVNWTGDPVKNFELRVTLPTPGNKASLASGSRLNSREAGGHRLFTFDLDVADTLILR